MFINNLFRSVYIDLETPSEYLIVKTFTYLYVTETYLTNSLHVRFCFQSVLNELLSESLPALHAHLKYYGVDISTVTFNWFITVFIDAVPFEVRNKNSLSIFILVGKSVDYMPKMKKVLLI